MAARFTNLISRAIAVPVENIDTDQITPARFLKVTDRKGLEGILFYDWRYQADGSLKPDFPLNLESSKGAQILIGGDNFGCGSSREHAPWALIAWGFRAIISTSFADIFRNNALKNGLLPVEVSPEAYRALLAEVGRDSGTEVTVDLEPQTVKSTGGTIAHFDMDLFAKQCLLEGIDELDYLLSFDKEITGYEARHV